MQNNYKINNLHPSKWQQHRSKIRTPHFDVKIFRDKALTKAHKNYPTNKTGSLIAPSQDVRNTLKSLKFISLAALRLTILHVPKTPPRGSHPPVGTRKYEGSSHLSIQATVSFSQRIDYILLRILMGVQSFPLNVGCCVVMFWLEFLMFLVRCWCYMLDMLCWQERFNVLASRC